MIQLDPTSRIPVYQQIKEQMTGLIVMGVFPRRAGCPVCVPWPPKRA